MRAVSRSSTPPPAGLTKRNKAGLTELERVREHMAAQLAPGQERKAFEFKVYKEEDVKRRLEGLFHGKCAYCESFYAALAPVDVEHYRPKGRVEGDPAHPGYWWLAMDWANLLPSCLDCNRRRKQETPIAVADLQVLHRTMKTGKQDSFPIAGPRAQPEVSELVGEQALLLDPTRDDPEAHLAYWLGEDKVAGMILPVSAGAAQVPQVPVAAEQAQQVAHEAAGQGLSVRGAVSIQVYGLNRLHLMQERARLVQRLRFLESMVVDVGRIIDGLRRSDPPVAPVIEEAVRGLKLLQSRVLTEMRASAAPTAPYSALAKAYLQDFKTRLEAPA